VSEQKGWAKPKVVKTREFDTHEDDDPLVWFGRKGPKPFEQNVLQRFRVDPGARVRALDGLVDLTNEAHIVLDHPETRRHDDSVLVRTIEPGLYNVFVSTPWVSNSRIYLREMPHYWEARIPGKPAGLERGEHLAHTMQMLTDGNTIYDLFAYPSVLRCETYVHRLHSFTSEAGVQYEIPGRFPKITRSLAEEIMEPFAVHNTEMAIERLMHMHAQATGALLGAYGVPAPYASVDTKRSGKAWYVLLTSEPHGGGENVVRASSPLRVERDLIGARQAQALSDSAIPMLSEPEVRRYTTYMSDLNRRFAFSNAA
jgi:hypothetical protein